MDIKNPDEKVIDAIESAIAWYRANQINGIRWERRNGENAVVKDKTAAPLWSRYYQIETMRPIFSGRDSVINTMFPRSKPNAATATRGTRASRTSF